MDGEYNGFIWSCVAVWATDRLLRFGRVLFLNKFPFTGTGVYNQIAGVIRVQVPVHRRIRPQAGSHYYLYVLHGWKPWESHPFTLMSWRDVTASQNGATREFSFLISPQEGLTKRLQQRLSAQFGNDENETAGSPRNLRVVVEGPYGPKHDIYLYPAALLIVGGSGITAAVSHLCAINHQLEQNEDENQKKHIRRIHLVWAVRNSAFFREVYQNDLAPICTSSKFSARIDISVSIHITGPITTSGTTIQRLGEDLGLFDEKLSTVRGIAENYAGASSIFEKSPMNYQRASEIKKSTNLAISHKRPIISNIVLNMAEESRTASGERLAVMSCGPESMANDVRESVASALDKGCDGVNYFPERFYW